MFDVKSVTATATSTPLATQRVRVRGLTVTPSAVAGSFILKDGGASGTERIKINTPAVAGLAHILIPGDGIVFVTDVHITITDVTSVTIFYG